MDANEVILVEILTTVDGVSFSIPNMKCTCHHKLCDYLNIYHNHRMINILYIYIYMYNLKIC